jgi:TPR repeat protein
MTAVLSLLVACSEYNSASQQYQAGNYKEALEQFNKLARGGDVRAQFDLAQMYNQGIGTTEDRALGLTWLRQSANGGNALAMLEMGMRYESGVGFQQNFIMALSWYHKASAAGNAIARFNIATMYVLGASVPKDLVRGYAWYLFADQLGSPASAGRMEKLEKFLTLADIERAKKIAAQLAIDPES